LPLCSAHAPCSTNTTRIQSSKSFKSSTIKTIDNKHYSGFMRRLRMDVLKSPPRNGQLSCMRRVSLIQMSWTKGYSVDIFYFGCVAFSPRSTMLSVP
jgi:hypothetical protein